jgi:HSP20 family protein
VEWNPKKFKEGWITMVLTEGKVTPTLREVSLPNLFETQLATWLQASPVRELAEIRETMVELFNELFRGTQNGFGLTYKPAVNMYFEDDQLVVEALMPGCGKNDIHVTAQPQSLVISGEISREKELKNEHRVFLNEFAFGRRYYRQIQLPVEVKPENIEAQYKNGILKLYLPVHETVYTKSVNVTVK